MLLLLSAQIHSLTSEAVQSVPKQWKKAVVIPLLKQEKLAEDANSYWPISLTSCLGNKLQKTSGEHTPLVFGVQMNHKHGTGRF